jgi:hypothetical protein
MSTFNDYWGRIVRANPQMSEASTTIRMAMPELERRLRLAYQQGAEDALKAKGDFAGLGKPMSPAADELYRKLFGGLPRKGS